MVVANLETILDSKDQDMSIDLSKPLKDQGPDFTFMQFRLDVDCYAVDDRITTAGPLSTYFSILRNGAVTQYSMVIITADEASTKADGEFTQVLPLFIPRM